MLGISIVIIIMLFICICILYFKANTNKYLKKLFISDDKSTFWFGLQNLFFNLISSLFVCLIGATFICTNVVCAIYIKDVSESEKYNESLKSKIRDVRKLATLTISWTWLQFIVYLIIYFLLKKFASKRINILLPDAKDAIALAEWESKVGYDHRIDP
jgi:hypothetical protein